MTERHVGFTGTRLGMSEEQMAVVASLLRRYGWLHHGDCFGADAEAHRIAIRLGVRTHAHPPRINTLRAFCAADVIAIPKPYMARNADIVAESCALIAAPAGVEPGTGSGTWGTIRLALHAKKPVTVVMPDGRMQRLGVFQPEAA